MFVFIWIIFIVFIWNFLWNFWGEEDMFSHFFLYVHRVKCWVNKQQFGKWVERTNQSWGFVYIIEICVFWGGFNESDHGFYWFASNVIINLFFIGEVVFLSCYLGLTMVFGGTTRLIIVFSLASFFGNGLVVLCLSQITLSHKTSFL